jgi:hypothetical protein
MASADNANRSNNHANKDQGGIMKPDFQDEIRHSSQWWKDAEKRLEARRKSSGLNPIEECERNMIERKLQAIDDLEARERLAYRIVFALIAIGCMIGFIFSPWGMR